MNRKMFSIGARVNEQQMEDILSFAKSVYPRRKYITKELSTWCDGEEPKYNISYNLTQEEYNNLCELHNKQYDVKFELLNIDNFTFEQLMNIIDDALCHLFEFKIENAQILYREMNR